VLAAAALALFAGPAEAEPLPWEVAVAEIEAGRLRNLAQRLSKQYVLYQFRLGEVRKSDLVQTAAEIDGVLEVLERGNPSRSIPAPWTGAIRQQVQKVDSSWGPLRKIAVASPYEHIRVSREYMPAKQRRADPLLVRYFDSLSLDLVTASEKLLAIYDEECVKTGLEVCPTARTSGYAAMVIERAAKEAVYVVAGVDSDQNRERLNRTIEEYQRIRRANDESTFFAGALDPNRGVSARAAGQLLVDLRRDWDDMEAELAILEAGDEQNFDIQRLLGIQSRLVVKVERLTGALVRYASATYGS
jgi:hypothetical protein